MTPDKVIRLKTLGKIGLVRLSNQAGNSEHLFVASKTPAGAVDWALGKVHPWYNTLSKSGLPTPFL